MAEEGLEMYKEICSKRFTDLEGKIDKIGLVVASIDKKLFKSNGQRAMVELVRDNREALKRHVENHDYIEVNQTKKPSNEVKKNSDIIKIMDFKNGLFKNVEPIDVIKTVFAFIIAIGMALSLLKQFGLLGVVDEKIHTVSQETVR